MATAELAVTMPLLVVLLVLAISAVTTVLDQVRCLDAARSTARVLARGDDLASALAAGRALAPAGATFTTSASDGMVEVRVSSPTAPALHWLGVRSPPSARAVAVHEDVGGRS
jgi:hypothetical protein